MEDFRGNELKVGDTVAVISPNWRSPGGSLVSAKVTRFTPKMIGVDDPKYSSDRERLVSPDKLVKIS